MQNDAKFTQPLILLKFYHICCIICQMQCLAFLRLAWCLNVVVVSFLMGNFNGFQLRVRYVSMS